MPLLFFIILGLLNSSFLNFSFGLTNGYETPQKIMGNSVCPLNLNLTRGIIAQTSPRLVFLDVPTECQYMLQGIRMLRSEYLKTTGEFLLPSNSSEACWDSYEGLVNEYLPGFTIRSTCGFNTSLISESCMNITTRNQFEHLIPVSKLREIRSDCNNSLENDDACASCRKSLSGLNESYFSTSNDGNVSDCNGYPFLYAAAFANRLGPADLGTAKCLFSLDFNAAKGDFNKRNKRLHHGFVAGSVIIGLVAASLVLLCILRRYRQFLKRKKYLGTVEAGWNSSVEIIGGGNALKKFSMDDIRMATRNFSRDNLIGIGGYGNVYKGILPDGSEVAFKRFKNCSAAGDGTFAHEVEVIASVRHVNLLTLRGYCTATMPRAGHQRIIASDFMQNGSLYDHLFRSGTMKLSWPIRQKIVLGMARGLAYLHHGAEHGIIHRDIKASNVLLDEAFEPKLADFGLAKFTPDGLSHFSTKVAGTLGYVAPEYALYGQLSERSDVYSFGVVVLEVLSGKNAVLSIDNNGTSLLVDWAWSFVREGRTLDVMDEGIPELGLPEVMEKYVLVAILSCHSLSHARPTMDQIVTILETDCPVPPIVDCRVPLPSKLVETQTSSSCSESNGMPSPLSFICKSDHPMLDHHSYGVVK